MGITRVSIREVTKSKNEIYPVCPSSPGRGQPNRRRAATNGPTATLPRSGLNDWGVESQLRPAQVLGVWLSLFRPRRPPNERHGQGQASRRAGLALQTLQGLSKVCAPPVRRRLRRRDDQVQLGARDEQRANQVFRQARLVPTCHLRV